MPVQVPSTDQIAAASLGGATLLVLLKLCELADVNGIVNKAQREIGVPLEMGDTYVRRCIKQLEEAGFVAIDKHRTGNVYRLLHAQPSTRGVSDLNRRAGSPETPGVNVRGVQAENLQASALQSTPNLEQIERPVIHVM